MFVCVYVCVSVYIYIYIYNITVEFRGRTTICARIPKCTHTYIHTVYIYIYIYIYINTDTHTHTRTHTHTHTHTHAHTHTLSLSLPPSHIPVEFRARFPINQMNSRVFIPTTTPAICIPILYTALTCTVSQFCTCLSSDYRRSTGQMSFFVSALWLFAERGCGYFFGGEGFGCWFCDGSEQFLVDFLTPVCVCVCVCVRLLI